ncbi:hypothetical protein CISG_07533 [Coccidioides immitis RMSCC 3703]|uniref:Uncharacterized protein n=1 Tax=Coccidioides immitis RMSCC 3703 TaxID=454286 RepID=A0A0J8R443_COCIT|nr:hypothetical protein CISG_07533 [Coccidioides immitis RMSCC 3703]
MRNNTQFSDKSDKKGITLLVNDGERDHLNIRDFDVDQGKASVLSRLFSTLGTFLSRARGGRNRF